jgi:hypothetical protein
MAQSATLDAKALGKAWGLFWSALVIFVGITSRLGWGTRWESLFGDLYPGYNQTVPGLVIGGFLAFLDGAFRWVRRCLVVQPICRRILVVLLAQKFRHRLSAEKAR